MRIGEERAALILEIVRIYCEQYEGWLKRNIFERQWVLRDFKKTVGLSAESFYHDMLRLKNDLTENAGTSLAYDTEQFEKLKRYYQRQYKLLQGYEKDPAALQKNGAAILSWIEMLDRLS